MADAFEGYATGKSDPANYHFSITPNDSTDLANIPRALRIDGAGTVALHDQAGTAVTYTCAAGEVLSIRARRVLATGTTATGIVGWY